MEICVKMRVTGSKSVNQGFNIISEIVVLKE